VGAIFFVKMNWTVRTTDKFIESSRVLETVRVGKREKIPFMEKWKKGKDAYKQAGFRLGKEEEVWVLYFRTLLLSGSKEGYGDFSATCHHENMREYWTGKIDSLFC